jgi:methanogenic corrinoid protein MtbC1
MIKRGLDQHREVEEVYTGNVSQQSAAAFAENKNLLLDKVNRSFTLRENLYELIGGDQNLQAMLDNHRNHVSFMSIVFQLQNFDLLTHTLPWVYRSYHNQGFSYDYFKQELQCWMEAMESVLEKDHAEEISGVYQWMIDIHDENIHNSQDQPEMSALEGEPKPDQEEFEKYLVAGDQRAVFDLVQSHVKNAEDLKLFYKEYITRAMYKIGMLWETGKISVAIEHLSSAIVTRVLSGMYTQIELPDINKGKVLISSATNEYHEIGAWMVANTFEIEGWDVQYLGANTPIRDLKNIVQQFQPDILGLSVTMPYNLDYIQSSINYIREGNNKTKIFVGGSIAVAFPQLLNGIDVDYIANGFEDALAEAERFWRQAG